VWSSSADPNEDRAPGHQTPPPLAWARAFASAASRRCSGRRWAVLACREGDAREPGNGRDDGKGNAAASWTVTAACRRSWSRTRRPRRPRDDGEGARQALGVHRRPSSPLSTTNRRSRRPTPTPEPVHPVAPLRGPYLGHQPRCVTSRLCVRRQATLPKAPTVLRSARPGHRLPLSSSRC
jgi:hypothetical protein